MANGKAKTRTLVKLFEAFPEKFVCEEYLIVSSTREAGVVLGVAMVTTEEPGAGVRYSARSVACKSPSKPTR